MILGWVYRSDIVSSLLRARLSFVLISSKILYWRCKLSRMSPRQSHNYFKCKFVGTTLTLTNGYIIACRMGQV